MKPVHEMGFQEFVDHAQPSSGMNRWPQLAAAQDVVSYSVYMNGEIVEWLPQGVREHEFRDVLLHPLTEKLGLDSHSLRDNLKVAQLLALRHTYMSCVLEASLVVLLSQETQTDYERLADSMSHPVIQAAVVEQQRLNGLLPSVMQQAEQVLGTPLEDKAAAGVSRGAVISQNEAFSVQDIGGGQVIAHENSRLQQLPTLGKEVIVAYYRGQGQVIEEIQSLAISEVYVDPASKDLAVKLYAGSSQNDADVKRVVLFHSIALVAEFAAENQLGQDFVIKAMDVRAAQPKPPATRAERKIIGEPFIDASSGLPAFFYQEQALTYTAVFNTIAELKEHAQAMAAPVSFRQALAQLVSQIIPTNQVLPGHEAKSWQAAEQIARQANSTQVQQANLINGRYVGPVLAVLDLHVVQDLGRGSAVIHDKRQLDKVPMAGERLAIHYRAGRGEVTVREASKERSNGRS